MTEWTPNGGPRVIHLTTAHPADDPRIFGKECTSLADAGYEVHLVAAGQARLDGSGVRVVVLPRWGGRLRRMVFAPARAAVRVLLARPRLVHLHDPELIPWGVVLRALGVRVVYDAHEDLPRQVHSKTYLPRPLRGAAVGVARVLVGVADRWFDAVVAATPSIAAQYSNPRTTLVQNFPRLEEWDSCPAPATRTARLAYVGGITEERGAWTMLDVLAGVAEDVPVRLLLAGPVRPPGLLAQMRGHRAWPLVDYLPWLDRHGVVDALSAATIGLALLRPSPNYLHSQPTKLFEYMAAGLPVVASDFPAWRSIIDGSGCGVVVDPQDVAGIVTTVRTLLTSPGTMATMAAAGRAAVARSYRWSTEAGRLIDLYAGILGPPPPGQP